MRTFSLAVRSAGAYRRCAWGSLPQIVWVYSGSSNGSRVGIDNAGAAKKSVGETGLVHIARPRELAKAQVFLRSLVELFDELPINADALVSVRGCAGPWENTPCIDVRTLCHRQSHFVSHRQLLELKHRRELEHEQQQQAQELQELRRQHARERHQYDMWRPAEEAAQAAGGDPTAAGDAPADLSK